MPAPYNISGFANSSRIEDMIVAANTASNQILVGGTMIALFVIITFTLMTKNKMSKSVLAASVACFLLSMFLWQAQLLSSQFVLWFIGIASLLTLMTYLTGQ